MPAELEGQQVAGQTPNPAANPPSQGVQSTPPPETGAVTSTTQQPIPSPQPTPQAPSWRDLASKQGLDLSGYANDEAAIQALAQYRQQAQQLQEVQPYLHEYMRDRQSYQEWRQQQQAAQQQTQQQAEKPWWEEFHKPPEYDPRWESQLYRDEEGNVRAKPGVAPDVVHKYMNYMQFRNGMTDKFLSNPYTFIEGPVKKLAAQVAQEIIQEKMGGYQDQVFAQRFIEDNTAWLYEHQNGQPVMDPMTGGKKLSAWGQQFGRYVQEAANIGIADVRKQQEYATNMCQRDYAVAQQKQTAAPQAQQQANQNFLQQNAAANAPNASGSGAGTPPNTLAPLQQSQNPSLPLGDRLRNAFRAAGITDLDLNGSAVR